MAELRDRKDMLLEAGLILASELSLPIVLQRIVDLAAQVGVAIANASLYEEVRARERWLDALRGITTQVLSGAPESSLLETIAEHARELAGAEAATIVTATATPGELVVAAAAGARANELRGQRMPAEGSISGAVMSSGKAVELEDVSKEAAGYQPIIAMGQHGPAFFVPLRVPGGVVGTLMVANLQGGSRFGLRTSQLVESLADAASVALEFDRAQSELRRLGLMEERERIAKELHDGIIQSLFAVGMSLQATALIAASAEP